MTSRLTFARVALVAALCAAALLGMVSTAVAQAGDATSTINVYDIDTTKFPVVSLKAMLPAAFALGQKPTFTLAENGVNVSGVQAAPLSATTAPPNIVLVIDTSGSMKGQALDDAKAAAHQLVTSLGTGAKIAIVSFASQAHTLTGFTDDNVRLNAAIDSLDANGETALYDAAVSAAKLMPVGAAGQRGIVLLSDGADTVSSASVDQALALVRSAGAPVYSVALTSREANTQALKAFADKSGGKLLTATASADLVGVFKSIAEDIRNTYTVAYKSTMPRSKDIELDVQASAGDRQASAAIAYPNPAFLAGGAQSEANWTLRTPTNDTQGLLLTTIVAFFSVALLVIGILLLTLRERPNLEQLRYYDELHAGSGAPVESGDPMQARVVAAVGQVAGSRGITQMVSQRLEAAGMPLRPAEYITGHLLIVIAIGVGVELLTRNWAAAVVAVVVATVTPIIALDITIDRRRAKFEEQLPDVLGMIAGSLRGGWGLQQAIALVVRETQPPIAAEFRRVDTELRLGMPIEQSLQSMADRMGSDDFQAAVTAIAIQREVGGNLAEVLDIVAKTIREREALRRQVKSLTAEGRLSTYILVGLPFIVIIMILVLNPGYLVPLYTTAAGAVISAIGLILLIVGTIWLFRTTKIEV